MITMPGNAVDTDPVKGLSEKQVPLLRQRFGRNIFNVEGSRRLWHMLRDIVTEPMFLLLAFCCVLYFVLGENNQGVMMVVAVALVGAISVYQDARSTRALNALKQYTEPGVTVVRDGRRLHIATEELVPGDIMVLEEGERIPADAQVIVENDFTVNESVITGESLPVEKYPEEGNNQLFQGSIVNSGACHARVTATGNATVLGKVGRVVGTNAPVKTFFQRQLQVFIRRFTLFGIIAFLIIWAMNYRNSGSLTESLLLGLTLALAAIPEEIPVAFSSFMALGAFHMARRGIITRQPQTIENLGSVNVVCLDKTGTLTENRMEVKQWYDYADDAFGDGGPEAADDEVPDVLLYGMLASEAHPFDTMEQAIHTAYSLFFDPRANTWQLAYEYRLGGRPPMMTHVYSLGDTFIAAAKGAAEKIIAICRLAPAEKDRLTGHMKRLAAQGYRVIGVAGAVHADTRMPDAQEEFAWTFRGLLALGDPLRQNAAAVLKHLYDAQIGIRLLTGDYPETAVHIALEAGIKNPYVYATGEQVMAMTGDELAHTVKEINIFARMFPEAKLKVIEALKAGGNIVAMTGDGVNDGPALKSADIGIAMGRKGTEIARRAANLVLTDDNLEKLVEAVSQGRKIFSNFKKAIRYIISIHIPIVFTAALPVALGWKYPNIFTPIHIIFLELVMGPTCSIFFEREPVEENIMRLPPRLRSEGLFRQDELLISVVQGGIIAAGILAIYYFFVRNGHTLQQTRAVVFTTLVLCNLLLTFTNRSFTENFVRTIRYKNNLAPWIFVISVLLLAIIHLAPPVRTVFGFSSMGAEGWAWSLGTAFVSVMWFEVYKTNLTETR